MWACGNQGSLSRASELNGPRRSHRGEQSAKDSKHPTPQRPPPLSPLRDTAPDPGSEATENGPSLDAAASGANIGAKVENKYGADVNRRRSPLRVRRVYRRAQRYHRRPLERAREPLDAAHVGPRPHRCPAEVGVLAPFGSSTRSRNTPHCRRRSDSPVDPRAPTSSPDAATPTCVKRAGHPRWAASRHLARSASTNGSAPRASRTIRRSSRSPGPSAACQWSSRSPLSSSDRRNT